jgi:putative alpha-1,2-mannosidase
LNPAYYLENELVIDVKNNGDENVYVQSAMLNGQPLEDSWFYRQDLINGGSLKLEMGPKPNNEWGIKEPPPSMSTY